MKLKQLVIAVAIFITSLSSIAYAKDKWSIVYVHNGSYFEYMGCTNETGGYSVPADYMSEDDCRNKVFQ